MYPGLSFSPDSPSGSNSTRLSYEDKEKFSTIINSGSHVEGDDVHPGADSSGAVLMRPDSPPPSPPKRPTSRTLLWLILLGPLVLALVVGIPVGLAASRASRSTTHQAATTKDDPTGNVTKHTEVAPITGGDGSTVTLEDGSKFVYSNPFGGYWVYDPSHPTDDSARPNTWTPPLNETWDWNTDKIYGVNLGGLFVLEPFITPALYQKYEGATDEWTLSTMMAADAASGGLSQLEDHYNTFITEKDIAEIAGAGLNWVRLPIPYWAIDTWPGEPFLAKTSWKYVVRLLGWCRKYGLRVNLDLHTVPGSQNGYNHSGRAGQVNFMQGTMGLANAQRALNYIRTITEFISQPEWKNVVPFFGILNEPIMPVMGVSQLQSFYVEAYHVVRNITGYGAGKGPVIGIHDGFAGPNPWANFMRGADRVVLDIHPYFAFGGGPANDPIANGTGPGAGGVWPGRACETWDYLLGTGRTNYGLTVAGEWSVGWNDCGLFLDGVGLTPTYGGNCEDWQNSAHWDDATKAGLLQFALASMDALDSWFFWTWKISNSTRGIVEAPLWSYQLGLQGGWLPKDPRTSAGTCAALGNAVTPGPSPYPAWMTGGDGAGPLTNAGQLVWPPATIIGGGSPASIPQYTATATALTLSPPTATALNGAQIHFGNGWFNEQDTAPAYTAIRGCTYPNSWDDTQNSQQPVDPICLVRPAQ